MPPKVRPKPLKHRDLLKRLSDHGITYTDKKGKGSERMLIARSGLVNGQYVKGQYKGPQYPIKHHGDGDEHSVPVVNAVLRHFCIAPEQFWQ